MDGRVIVDMFPDWAKAMKLNRLDISEYGQSDSVDVFDDESSDNLDDSMTHSLFGSKDSVRSGPAEHRISSGSATELVAGKRAIAGGTVSTPAHSGRNLRSLHSVSRNLHILTIVLIIILATQLHFHQI